MRLLRAATYVLGISLVASLSLTVRSYEQQQHFLTLEGNSLLSTQALQVVGDPSSVAREEQLPRDAEVFVPLAGDPRIRAVVLKGHNATAFPIYEGRQLEAVDTSVCLAGSRVPVSQTRDGVQFRSESVDCRVVGRLGIAPNSLLQDDLVYVASSEQVTTAASVMYVDGENIADFSSTLDRYGEVTPMGAGASGRSGVDFVSPVLIALGTAMATLGTILIGVLPADGASTSIRVHHVIGRSRRSIFGRQATRFALLYIVAMVSTTLLWWPTLGSSGGWSNYKTLVPLSLVLWVVFIAAMAARIRSITRWRS